MARYRSPPPPSALLARRGGEPRRGWAGWHAYDTPDARRQLDFAREALIPGADPLAAALVRQLAARVLADEGDVAVGRRILAGDTELPAGPPFLTVMLELLQGELALGAAGRGGCRGAHRGAGGSRLERPTPAARRRPGDARRPPQDVRDLLAPVLHPAASSAPRAEACAAAGREVELALDLSAPDDLDVELVRRRVRDLLSRTAPQRLIRVFAPLLATRSSCRS